MTFFRQITLLLPSAFLLGVLLFLLTHGRGDAGFGAYPFLEQWFGADAARWTPEVRFLVQTAIFFVPAYGIALLSRMRPARRRTFMSESVAEKLRICVM